MPLTGLRFLLQILTGPKKFYSAIFDFEMPEMMTGPNKMGFLLFEQQGGKGAAIVQGEWYTPSDRERLSILTPEKI